MTTLTNGDVLQGPTPVIPVNLMGAMGRGLALAARNRWSWLLSDYRRALRTGALDLPAHPGEPARIAAFTTGSQTIILAPTKVNWRDPSPPDLVKATIRGLASAARQAGTTTLNVPPLGCGLGGLSHETVAPWITEAIAADPDIHWRLHRWPRGLFNDIATLQ